MEFGLSELQRSLQDSVLKFLDDACPLETVRKIATEAEADSSELWSGLADLGVAGLMVPRIRPALAWIVDAVVSANGLGNRRGSASWIRVLGSLDGAAVFRRQRLTLGNARSPDEGLESQLRAAEWESATRQRHAQRQSLVCIIQRDLFCCDRNIGLTSSFRR